MTLPAWYLSRSASLLRMQRPGEGYKRQEVAAGAPALVTHACCLCSVTRCRPAPRAPSVVHRVHDCVMDSCSSSSTGLLAEPIALHATHARGHPAATQWLACRLSLVRSLVQSAAYYWKTETHCAFGSEKLPQQMPASRIIMSNS